MAHDLVCWKCGAALAELSLPLRRSEEHTSELQSQSNLVCRLLLEKKKNSTAKFSISLSASPSPLLTTNNIGPASLTARTCAVSTQDVKSASDSSTASILTSASRRS